MTIDDYIGYACNFAMAEVRLSSYKQVC